MAPACVGCRRRPPLIEAGVGAGAGAGADAAAGLVGARNALGALGAGAVVFPPNPPPKKSVPADAAPPKLLDAG